MARKPPVLLALLALLLVAPATALAATVLAVSLVQDRRAARVSLSAAGRNAVPLRFDAAGLRHLRRTRRVRIVLRAVLADAAGNRRIATRAVTLAR